jgi:hypothetical protein
VLNGLPDNPTTDANGYFLTEVPYGWSGTVTPTKPGYTFSPPSYFYPPVFQNLPIIFFSATLVTFNISGYVYLDGNPLSDATMIVLPGYPVPVLNGSYTITVNVGWTGTVTPSKPGYTFSPSSTAYTDVQSNQGKDYTATLHKFSISGTVGNPGGGTSSVVMNGLPGNPITNSAGYYFATVPYDWSGTVTPAKQCYTFTPPSQPYSNVKSDQVTNYIANGPVIPGNPTGFKVTGATQTQIFLSWNAVPCATSYNVYQDGVVIPVSISTTCFTVGASCGTTHCYYINAGNNCGWSGPSNTVCITIAPCTPTGFTATPVSGSQINLSWNAVPGATTCTLKGYYGATIYTGPNTS